MHMAMTSIPSFPEFCIEGSINGRQEQSQIRDAQPNRIVASAGSWIDTMTVFSGNRFPREKMR
jgi:hypothetical protein